MRHERPLPGRPTPVETVNATLIKRRLVGAYARETRVELGPNQPTEEGVRDVVVADMVELLDEGRISRGYADIYDLARAGYHVELAAALGPHAAKLLGKRIAERGEHAQGADDAASNMEAA